MSLNNMFKVENVDQYVKDTTDKLDAIAKMLGWNVNVGNQQEQTNEFITCPRNPSHRFKPGNLDRHILKCSDVLAAQDLPIHERLEAYEHAVLGFETPSLQSTLPQTLAGNCPIDISRKDKLSKDPKRKPRSIYTGSKSYYEIVRGNIENMASIDPK